MGTISRRAMVGALSAVLLAGSAGITLVRAAKRPVGGGEPATAAAPAEQYREVFVATALDAILAPVRAEVEVGAFPGAAVAVGIGANETHLAGVGAIGWTRNAAPVDPGSTMYDLASVTKVIATASAVMLLVDEGRIALDDPVSRYLPEFAEGAKARVTIRHLLTHTSGLPAGAVLRGNTRAERIARAKSFSIYPPAGARVEYSDVGFIVLWEAAEKAAGEALTAYLERRLYRPLGMTSTHFSPGLDCEACAPTGRLRDQSLYRGQPFDPLGQRLDGFGGNSGLFSTAHDLGRFAAMITNGGELDGVRVLSEETVREFIGAQPVGRGRFRLGWEVFCAEAGENGGCEEPQAIGHTGWTGTAIFIQPRSGLWLVLLTNRTYGPRAPNRIQRVRSEMLALASGVLAGR